MSQSLAHQAQAIADLYEPPAVNGRHSAIADPDTVETLLKAFRSGLNDRDCCLAAGINPRTLTRWHEIAEANPTSAQALFVETLKRERANGKLRRLQRIERAADDPKYWASNAWILERTDPEQFALRREDSQTPQVVVQIGAGVGEVKVGIGIVNPTFAPPTSSVNEDLHRLTADTASDKRDYVNQKLLTERGLDAAPAIEIPAVESAGGPQGVEGAAGGHGAGATRKRKKAIRQPKATRA